MCQDPKKLVDTIRKRFDAARELMLVLPSEVDELEGVCPDIMNAFGLAYNYMAEGFQPMMHLLQEYSKEHGLPLPYPVEPSSQEEVELIIAVHTDAARSKIK